MSYHGARGAGYVALGVLAGSAGGLVDLAGVLTGVQSAAAILAAVTLILSGLVLVARHAGLRIPARDGSSMLRRAFGNLQRRALQLRGSSRAFAMGATTALLPCGWLYAFLTLAAGAASATGGAAVMLAFWLGTLPILSAVGLGVRGFGAALGPRLRLALSAALIGVGTFALLDRSDLRVASLAAHAEAHRTDAAGVPSAADAPACCDEPVEAARGDH